MKTQKELRDGQSDINKLTKQWFDDANRDAKLSSDSTVYFKKSSNRANGIGLNSLINKSNDKTKYHMLNTTTGSSNILLDTTEDENEDDQDKEDVVIDKTTSFIN